MINHLLLAVSEKGTELDPTFMTDDFELASTNALRQVFPEGRLYDYFFQLDQSIYQSTQENSIVVNYKSNENVNLSLRKIYDASVAFLNSIQMKLSQCT